MATTPSHVQQDEPVPDLLDQIDSLPSWIADFLTWCDEADDWPSRYSAGISLGERCWLDVNESIYWRRFERSKDVLLRHGHVVLNEASRLGVLTPALNTLVRDAGSLQAPDGSIAARYRELFDGIRVELAEVRHSSLKAIVEGTPALAPAPEAADQSAARVGSECLSPAHEALLQATCELRAVDEITRKTAAEIVRRAFGANSEPNSHKKQLRYLVVRGLLQSAPSVVGGYWLTPRGQSFTDRLMKRP